MILFKCKQLLERFRKNSIIFAAETMATSIVNQAYSKLLSDLKSRVASSRYKAALSVNSELIRLYHHIGTQILEAQERQGWGTKIITQLSKDLRAAFP